MITITSGNLVRIKKRKIALAESGGKPPLFLALFLIPVLLTGLASCQEQKDPCLNPVSSQLPQCCSAMPVSENSDFIQPCFTIPQSVGDYQGSAKVDPLETPNTDDSFQDLSNRIFVAVNWAPLMEKNDLGNSSGIRNGMPDLQFKMGSQDNVALWETWRTTDEVFRREGPLEWNAKPPLPGPASCRSQYIQEIKELSQTNPGVSVENVRDLSRNSNYGPPSVLNGNRSDLDQTLYDVYGSPVLYEVAMNKTTFDYIVLHGLYSQKGLAEYLKNSETCPSPDPGDLQCDPTAATHTEVCQELQDEIDWKSRCRDDFTESCQKKLIFPGGDETSGQAHQASIFVKAAWRILNTQDASEKFHRSFIITPPEKRGDKCGSVKLGGLVALHIIYKTNIDGEEHSNWSWATFEHDSNAPAVGKIIAMKVKWSFFDPSETEEINCPLSSNSQQRHQNLERYQAARPYGMAIDANEKYKKALSPSAWSRYSLTGTQWWESGNPASLQSSRYGQASSVIEPYIQRISSCALCHDGARVKIDEIEYPSDGIFALGNAPY